MKDEPRMGFLAPLGTAKKKGSDQVQNTEPRTVNNYFTVAIDPKAILFVLMLFVVVYAMMRYAPKMEG